MKPSDIKGKKDTELVKLLGERRKELRDARFDAAGSAQKDAHHKRKLRKNIARILTEMRARTGGM